MSSEHNNKRPFGSSLLDGLREAYRGESLAPDGFQTGEIRHGQANLLKSLIDAIPSPVFFKDLQGRFVGCNRAYEELTGIARHRLLGKRPTEIESWDQADLYEESDQQPIENGMLVTFITQLRDDEGQIRDVEVHKTILKDIQGRPVGLVGVLIDITDKLAVQNLLRKAKESLEKEVEERDSQLLESYLSQFMNLEQCWVAELEKKKTESRYQHLFENLPVGVIHQLSNGEIVEANPAAQEILGLTHQQIKDRYHLDKGRRPIKLGGTEIPFEELPSARALREKRPIQSVVLGAVNAQQDQMRWLHVSAQPFTPPGEKRPSEVFVTLEDITDIKAQSEQLKADRDFVQAVLDTVDAIVLVLDPEGNIARINRKGLEITEYAPREILGRAAWRDWLRKDHIQEIADFFAGIKVVEKAPYFEGFLKAKSGAERMVAWYSTTLTDDQGNLQYVIATGIDVTERRAAEDFTVLAYKVFETANEGVIVTDREGNIEFVNHGFTAITGYSAEEALGQNPRLVKSDRHPPEFYEAMWHSLIQKGRWRGEVWNRRKNGEAYPEWLAITAIKDEQGRTRRYVGVFQDLTEIKYSQEQLEYFASHDALTGLPNRDQFAVRLEAALAHTREESDPVGLFAVDIDGFKHVNDAFGHVAGDKLLQLIAERLGETAGKEAVITRMGGDLFMILVENMPGPSQAAQLARDMISALNQPVDLDGNELFPSACVGISLSTPSDTTPDGMIINADLAVHRAKKQGKGSYHFYTSELNDRIMGRLKMESDLRRALDNDEFRVFYQPRVHLFSGRIAGMEALVRWQRDDGALVSPLEFIPVAEESGLIIPIGEWVLGQACHQAQAWRDEYGLDLFVSVNLSVKQFREEALHKKVAHTLASSGLPPTALELELTESAFMRDTDQAIAIMNRITKTGVTFALDDFGTGYSSLSYMQRLPMSVLKVDKSFVDRTPRDQGSSAIVATIIAMAHATRMKAVAEGVETRDQLSFLQGLSCDQVQGFYFSRPLPADRFGSLLREGKGKMTHHQDGDDQ